MRDMFFDGNTKAEAGAVIWRVAPSLAGGHGAMRKRASPTCPPEGRGPGGPPQIPS
jgi:hypothetical protein